MPADSCPASTHSQLRGASGNLSGKQLLPSFCPSPPTFGSFDTHINGLLFYDRWLWFYLPRATHLSSATFTFPSLLPCRPLSLPSSTFYASRWWYSASSLSANVSPFVTSWQSSSAVGRAVNVCRSLSVVGRLS